MKKLIEELDRVTGKEKIELHEVKLSIRVDASHDAIQRAEGVLDNFFEKSIKSTIKGLIDLGFESDEAKNLIVFYANRYARKAAKKYA